MYWLYVAGDEEAVLMIAEYTHDATFPGKAIYNVWDFILYIWGLEVYLYIKRAVLVPDGARTPAFPGRDAKK